MKKVIRIEPATLTQATKKLRVAAYCRVSTGMEDQLVSLEVQKEHYESYIKSNPNWDYAGLYYDEYEIIGLIPQTLMLGGSEIFKSHFNFRCRTYLKVL